ncbi:MAG: type 1 glutamine amidotransferase [Nocardioides sp.]
MSSRLLVVEHDAYCPPALLGEWLAAAGCRLDVCRPYAEETLPNLDDYDGLLILGGPMDAGDDRHHWLEPTRQLVRDAADRLLPALGVCLGHQLCALAFGGEVDRDPLGQQVGLLDIAWTEAAATDDLVAGLLAPRRGVHWNDDLVTALPPGAVPLAVSPEGELQAARFAPTVWGIQWHPEVDVAVIRRWAEEDAERHLEGGIDQERVLAEIEAARDELERAWRPLADAFTALAARGRPE